MGRRRRRSRGQPPTCRDCKAPIVWLVLRGNWRTFDPTPVDPRATHSPHAYPVEGKRAWTVTALTEELMGRYETDHADAKEHVYAMPWHVLHACPPNTGTPADVDTGAVTG